MAYQYRDPVEEGWDRITLTRKQHKELFPKDPMNIFNRSNYYVKYDMYDGVRSRLPRSFKMFTYINLFGQITLILLFPIIIVCEGFSRIKSTVSEIAEFFRPLEKGVFVENSTNDPKLIEEILAVAKPY